MNDFENNFNHPTLDETDTSKDASLTSLYSAPLFVNETDLTKHEFANKKIPLHLIGYIAIDSILLGVGILLIILAETIIHESKDILVILGSILVIISCAIAMIYSIYHYTGGAKKIVYDKRIVNFYEESLVSETFSNKKLISTYTIPYIDIDNIAFAKTRMIITHDHKRSFSVDIGGFKDKADYKKVFDLIYTYKK